MATGGSPSITPSSTAASTIGREDALLKHRVEASRALLRESGQSGARAPRTPRARHRTPATPKSGHSASQKCNSVYARFHSRKLLMR